MSSLTYSLTVFVSASLTVFLGDCILRDCVAEETQHENKQAEEKVFDPVCEMKVKKENARVLEFEGKLFYFCSYECRDKFDKDPYKFACPCRSQIHPDCVCEHCEGETARCKCPQAEEISPFQPRGKKAFDPVCGMTVGKEKAINYSYHGFIYYFCSAECRKKFSDDPYQFACLCSTEHTNCVCDHCEEKAARCGCKESEETKRRYQEGHASHEK